nr:hypothetical protein [Tanacetum cinerariifolium]
MMVMIVNIGSHLFMNRNRVTIKTMMIQTPQYPDVHPPSQEMNEEVFQAKGDLMKSIQTFLEKFNCIHFGEKPQILFQAWKFLFAVQYSNPENPNELFQKLLEDLKELAEYENSQSRDRPIFLNDDEQQEVKNVVEHPAECGNLATILSTKEPEYSSSMGYEHLSITPETESDEVTDNSTPDRVLNSFEFDNSLSDTFLPEYETFCDNMEEMRSGNTTPANNLFPNMIRFALRLSPIRKEAEYGRHNADDDLIESALNTKLLLINSQRLEKEQQEVKNVVEQPAERGNLATILSTKEPEYSSSMGYEHLSITPKTESDEVTESNAENLLPIPSEYEVTLEDKKECDLPVSENSPICDDHSEILSDFKSDDDISVYNDFENIEYVEASLSNPEIERLIYVLKNDISDDSSNEPLLEEADLFLTSDNSIPPGIENFADDSEGDIRFLEELLIDDSILSHESSKSNFEDNPSVPRPPPEPPDAETDVVEEIVVVMNDKDKFDEDYYFFMFVKVFSLLSAESEDTVFDPADVHLDDLCPPNKRYDLMDANKKIDLEHVQCLPESKIWNEDSSLDDLRGDEAHEALSDVCGEIHMLTPPTPMPTVDKVDEMILQDILQVSLAEHKSKEEQEARENVELVNEHLEFVEIKKMVKGQENVIDDSSISRNDENNIPDTREKGKIVEESRNTPFSTPIRSYRIYTYLVSLDTKKLQKLTVTDTKSTPSSCSPNTKRSFVTLANHLQEVMVDSLPTVVKKHVKEQVPEQVRDQVPKAIANDIPSQVDSSVKSYMSRHILHVHPAPSQTTSVLEQQYQLYIYMIDNPQLQQQDIAIWLALQMKFGILQKTSEYEAYTSGESSSGQDNEKEQGPSTLGNQVQVDDYDIWTGSYASDDDEIPTKQVSQDIMEEVSLTIDEQSKRKLLMRC